MNIIKRKKNENYSIVSNYFYRDKNLSHKAKGVLGMIMTFPDNWDFSVKGLISISKEGKDSVYSTIKELKEAGYCEVKKVLSDKGFVLGYEYLFFEYPNDVFPENPHPENPHPENPHPENPHPENPHPENPTQLNIQLIKETNNQIKESEKEKKTHTPKKKKEFVLDYPFHSEKFLDTWNLLRDQPKWKDKLENALQLSLNKLAKFDEEFAIEQMERAIESNWTGVVFPDTKKHYEEWRKQDAKDRSNNTKPVSAGIKSFEY